MNQGEQKRMAKEGKNCVRKFAFATRVGFHPHNPNKVNQDSYILAPNVQGLPALHIFGICDGHGQFGRDVSNYVKVALPNQIERKYGKDLTKTELYEAEKEGFNMHHPYLTLSKQCRDAFFQVNRDIEDNVPNC